MFNKHASEILEMLLTNLDTIKIQPGGELQGLVDSARFSLEALKKLETQLESYEFSNTDEEIQFFKTQKPQIEGRLLYYIRLCSILQLAPVSDQQRKKDYFKTQLVSIEQFYREHSDLYLYYKMEYTYLDTYYFTRKSDPNPIMLDNLQIVMDQRFHTRKSNHFSHFFAFNLLSAFLNLLIEENIWDPSPRKDDKLIWTGTQAELVELLYALNEAGVLGGKQQNIKKLTEWAGRILGIKLTNPYASNGENRMRKKDRTAFMNKLIRLLEAKYDYDDETAL